MTARIIRPLTGRMQVRGPPKPNGDEPSNKSMFRDAAGAAILPTWVDAAEGQPGLAGCWTIAREHLTEVAESVAIRDLNVEIEMYYRPTEKCDLHCRRAEGDDCTCACECKHHGKASEKLRIAAVQALFCQRQVARPSQGSALMPWPCWAVIGGDNGAKVAS